MRIPTFGTTRRALLLSLVAGAALAQTPPAPVLVGVNIPRTGPAAPLGALAEPAILLAVEQINASGGIKSLGGARIELKWADNQGNPSLSASEEQRLIQREQVSVVIGGLSSAAELTATQTAERLKVPHVIGVAATNEITERGFKYTFMISCRAVDYAKGFVDTLNSLRDDHKLPMKRVVVLNENSPYGSSVAKDLLAMLKKASYEVADHIEYPLTTSDASPVLSRIRALRPDVVLHIGFVGDSILMWNTRRQLEMENLPFIGITSGIGSPAFLKAVGPAANGALTLSQTNADIPRDTIQNFARAYEAKFKLPPENNGFFSYQSVYVVRAALEKAASRNPEAIRNALASLDMRTDVVLPAGVIKFGSTGANQDSSVVLLQVRDGKLATVWPPTVATTKIDLKPFDALKK
jgi:branched-chain amino acid transport system substrate-binding protein